MLLNFNQYSIPDDGFGNHYLIKFYSSSIVHFVFVDYEGNFEVGNDRYHATDVEFYTLVTIANLN